MLNEIIEVKTNMNLILFGNLFSKDNDSCALFIPGMAGNYYDNNFGSAIAKVMLDNNIDFLFSHNQGSYHIANFKYEIDGKIKHKLIGSAYESLDESDYDIDAWVSFLLEKGYKKIYLIAHSLGCNKIVKYLDTHSCDEFVSLVLLSPQDLKDATLYKKHRMYIEACTNMDNNQPDRLLSDKFLNSFIMSSRTFKYFIDNIDNINNIPYKNSNGDFKILEKLDIPIYTIIGSKDLSDITLSNLNNLYKHIKLGNYYMVNGAKHNFNNYETELALKIIEFIK